MIYTSYYGKLKKMPKNIEPISISRWKPKGISILSYPKLRPDEELLAWWKSCSQTEEDKEKYIKEFNKKLNSLDIDIVRKELAKLSCGRDIVLLCYEKSDEFCHRHLVSKWFNDHDLECTEWDGEEKIIEEKNEENNESIFL